MAPLREARSVRPEHGAAIGSRHQLRPRHHQETRDRKGFIVLPRRRVIERSLGGLVKQRRLTRDHEENPRHHEAFVYLAFIGIMTQRLTSLQPLESFAGQAFRHLLSKSVRAHTAECRQRGSSRFLRGCRYAR